MQTTIKQVSPVQYELEITAKADDLAPAFNKALRAQQARTQMKGFRPGKVPLSLVKKMYGKALAFELADREIQKTYEDVVLEAGEHDVLGQPVISTFEYEMDGDLRAVVQFGVRPDIVLKDLSREQATKLVYAVTDEDVEQEIERLRKNRADLVPVEDEPAGEHDLVVFDLQELDAATRTAIIGKRDEDQSIFLDDPRLEDSPLMAALAKALRGAKAGDTVRFHYEHDEAHGLHAAGHAHFFAATVKDVKRRDVPALDAAFVEEVTGGRFEDVDAFRADVRRQLEQLWKQRTRDFLESTLTRRMLELHPVPVPPSAVEVYLDSFVEDVKRRNKGELPPDFSVEEFRGANRGEAEEQARWMLIRDQIIGERGFEVNEADLDAYFEEEARDDAQISAPDLRRFYQAVPRLMEQLEERILSRKVFDYLAGAFELVEKDRETIEREVEARRAEDAAVARLVMTEQEPSPESAGSR